MSKKCLKHSIIQDRTELDTPKQNPAELQGGILKKRMQNRMRKTSTPVRLWDYCLEYESALRTHTASTHMMNEGATAFEKVMGYTPNISEYIQHSWYDWV